MHTIVIFTSNNARIKHVTNSELSKWKSVPGSYINPDLSKVNHLPPHYWKVDNGHILPMTTTEIIVRDAQLSLNGADNNIGKPKRGWGEYIASLFKNKAVKK